MSPVACVFVRGFVSGSVSRGSFERVSSSLGFSSSLSGSPSTFVLLAVSASMVFVVGDGMGKNKNMVDGCWVDGCWWTGVGWMDGCWVGGCWMLGAGWAGVGWTV